MNHTNFDRAMEITAFLEQHGWANAEHAPFDADFSPRRYARLQDKTRTAVLMDADNDQKTPEFVSITNLLRDCTISAPDIYAADTPRGLLLMQDFGQGNVGSLIDAGGDRRDFALRAARLLARMHSKFGRGQDHDTSGLPLFSTDLFTRQAELFLDFYIPFAKRRDASEEERQDFRAAWRAALRPVEVLPKSLMLRDFMPDNLMDLSGSLDDAQGDTIKLGVLDFQDGGVGPIAYDLASLCEEVRRDGGWDLLPAVMDAYLAARTVGGDSPPPSKPDLIRACTILSAQRHIRILGIVAGQALRQGRHEKLDFLPRIRRHLDLVLAAPYLMPVRELMTRFGLNHAV
jgi:aminoglycoside/choline kinase family phosphotransferase